MNNLDQQYTDLLKTILEYGVDKKDRTGTGTKSIFGYTIRHNMKDGFPLLTTKKMPFKTIVTELLWFLRGDTNIKYLVDNDCHIWDGDAYKAYLKKYEKDKLHGVIYENDETQNRPFSKEEFINWVKNNDKFSELYGDLGPIYGKQWRQWESEIGGNLVRGIKGDWIKTDPMKIPTDQIKNLINDLKTNPDSRRLMVNAWAVHDLPNMVLPPCHYGFQVYTRELSDDERAKLYEQKTNVDTSFFPVLRETLDFHNIPTRAISLMWNQRSVDTFLGLPFNIASYGLLLEIIAKEVNMVPEELIGNLGDVHLYSNHIEQAKEQIGRELTHDEKVEYARSLYGKEEWWNVNDKRVITVLQKKKQTREPFPLPTLIFNPIFLANLEHKGLDEAINGEVNFQLENYQSHPSIKAPLSN